MIYLEHLDTSIDGKVKTCRCSRVRTLQKVKSDESSSAISSTILYSYQLAKRAARPEPRSTGRILLAETSEREGGHKLILPAEESGNRPQARVAYQEEEKSIRAGRISAGPASCAPRHRLRGKGEEEQIEGGRIWGEVTGD
jgi:hypothetical protein